MRVREHELDDADGQRGNQGLVVAVTNNTEVPGGQQPQELPEPLPQGQLAGGVQQRVSTTEWALGAELSRTFLRPSRQPAACAGKFRRRFFAAAKFWCGLVGERWPETDSASPMISPLAVCNGRLGNANPCLPSHLAS